MRIHLLIFAFASLLLICCNTRSISQTLIKILPDSLIVNIDKYRNTKVEVEGLIIHVCSFNGKKLKLKTNSGKIIKIVPQDSLAHFDTSLYNKRVRVVGTVQESRIEKSYIDKVDKERTLLCHIDNTPCKDKEWVKRQIVANRSDSISIRNIERLRLKMEQTKKDYISVVTIVAERCEIIKEITR